MASSGQYDDLVISKGHFTKKIYRFEPGTKIYVRNYDDTVYKLSSGQSKTTIKAGGQPVSVDLAVLCGDKSSSKYDLSLLDVNGAVTHTCSVVFSTASAGGYEHEIKKREQLRLSKKQYAEKAQVEDHWEANLLSGVAHILHD